MQQRARLASRVPTLVVRDRLTEADLVQAIELGAQDVVTLHAQRPAAERSRRANCTRRDSITRLTGTLASAHQYRDQMRAFMTGSTDAIAHVQEGIVVDVNPAWVELFGRRDASELARPAADGLVRRRAATPR